MFNFFNNTYSSNNRESSMENKNQSLCNNAIKNEDVINQNALEKATETILNQNKNPAKINATVDFGTLQKARQDLVGEIQAVIEYDEHIHNTTDKLARETWENIKSEELTHTGELMALLNYLDPTQKKYVDAGIKEFTERMNKI